MTSNAFDEYWNTVKDILGEVKVDEAKGQGIARKSTAIRFSAETKPPFNGVDAIQRLYRTLGGEGWKKQEDAGSNWLWRNGEAKSEATSGEVALERAIVRIGNQAGQLWSWQMSTTSGVLADNSSEKNATNKRRAIDLVRNNGNGSYTFIELKIGSDNPLYALFELLGYFLAYLHARNAGWKAKDPGNDFLQAVEIKLVVLGPDSWYQFKARGSQPTWRKFDLKWMLPLLIEGLEALEGNKPKISISFERFSDPIDSVAKEIVNLAADWKHSKD